MALWPSIVLVLYAINAGAAKTTLSTELTNLIPTCAQDCFTSFLDFNFALTKCGINPTLDCLCTTKSVTEYTVGEGAVQCVLLAADCSSLKSREAIAFKTYTMCDGRRGALPNTHATLTATMTSPSATASTLITTSRSNFSASTIITASTTSSSISPSLITTIQTTARSTTTEVPPSPTNPAPEASSETPAPSPPRLTREQTIGISIGSSVGAFAIFGLIFFACWRRRQYRRSRDSDMLPFQMDPTNDLNYRHGGLGGFVETKIYGPGATFNGVAAKKPPKIPPRLDISNPNMFSRRSIKPDMIGVAISPDNKGSFQEKQRRASRLLPDKPNLTLAVPINQKQSNRGNAQPKNGASNVSRQSTATQFEEDFDSADTAVAGDDVWAVGPNGQALRDPNGQGASVKQIRPEQSQPAPAFFVTTGANGDTWRAGQAATVVTVQSAYDVKPLNLTRGPVGSFSQPRKPNDYPTPARILNYQNETGQQQQQQQPQQQPQQNKKPSLQVVVPNRSNERPITNGSSIYSGSLPPSATGSRPQSIPRTRRSFKAVGPYDRNPRHQSSGSLTSFETADSAVSPENVYPPPLIQPQSQTQRPLLPPIDTTQKEKQEVRRATMMLELSPVVESPPSAKGVSPVSYPKIPKQGRLPENTIRMVPPPAQPDFMSVFSSGRRPERRVDGSGISPDVVSPLEQSATPIDTATANTPSESNMKPWRVAEIKAQRDRERQAELQKIKDREEEARSADIEIRMMSPEITNNFAPRQVRAQLPSQMQASRPQNQSQPMAQQQPDASRLQSFRLGQEQMSSGPSTSSSTTLPYPPRIQPQLLPQQRRLQQEREIQQQQQRSYFPNQQPQAQQSLPNMRPQQSLQQQLNQSYQAYDPSIHGRNQPRSSTAPLPQDTDRGNFLKPVSQLSHTRSSSVSSTTSSLLAKRRGENMERGMALNLSSRSNLNTNGHERRGSQKWRVLDDQQKAMAKSQDWRPTLGGGTGGTQWVEIDRQKEKEMGGLGSGLTSGDLPKTPGWVPKLTPTRRGDELFLSVA